LANKRQITERLPSQQNKDKGVLFVKESYTDFSTVKRLLKTTFFTVYNTSITIVLTGVVRESKDLFGKEFSRFFSYGSSINAQHY